MEAAAHGPSVPVAHHSADREADVLEGWPGFDEGIDRYRPRCTVGEGQSQAPIRSSRASIAQNEGGIIIQPWRSMLNANTEYL